LYSSTGFGKLYVWLDFSLLLRTRKYSETNPPIFRYQQDLQIATDSFANE